MTPEVYQMMLQVWYMLGIQLPGHCKCSLTFPPNEGTTFSLAFREQGFWAWVVVWGLVTQGLATNHPLMIASSFSSQETSNKTKQNTFSPNTSPQNHRTRQRSQGTLNIIASTSWALFKSEKGQGQDNNPLPNLPATPWNHQTWQFKILYKCRYSNGKINRSVGHPIQSRSSFWW